MWSPWGYPQQQPFIMMPWPQQQQPQSQPIDELKVHKKLTKWIKKYQEEEEKKKAGQKKPEPPKTASQKFMTDKSMTYWDVMKFVIAFGPPATYVWSLLMIHMWNNLKDAVSTLH